MAQIYTNKMPSTSNLRETLVASLLRGQKSDHQKNPSNLCAKNFAEQAYQPILSRTDVTDLTDEIQ